MTFGANQYSQDPNIPAVETAAAAEESTGTEAITPTHDPLIRLQADLDAAKIESEQWRDRFLRKAAEFDNFRKRTDKEKADLAIISKSSLLLEFLTVSDACERALESFKGKNVEQQPGLEQYREGVELLYRQMLDVFNRIGVVSIEAYGKPFDPHFHEALAREVTSEFEENTVIRILRRGYLFKDRLLRPAQVNVSIRPQTVD